MILKKMSLLCMMIFLVACNRNIKKYSVEKVETFEKYKFIWGAESINQDTIIFHDHQGKASKLIKYNIRSKESVEMYEENKPDEDLVRYISPPNSECIFGNIINMDKSSDEYLNITIKEIDFSGDIREVEGSWVDEVDYNNDVSSSTLPVFVVRKRDKKVPHATYYMYTKENGEWSVRKELKFFNELKLYPLRFWCCSEQGDIKALCKSTGDSSEKDVTVVQFNLTSEEYTIMYTLKDFFSAGGVAEFSFSPDGSYIANHKTGFPLRIFDSNNGELLHEYELDKDHMAGIFKWSPHSDQICISYIKRSNNLEIINISNGKKCIFEIPGNCLAFCWLDSHRIGYFSIKPVSFYIITLFE